MSASSLKEEGSDAWKSGNFTVAIEKFSAAIQASSGDREMLKILYSNRSACYMKTKHYHAALADASKCLEYDPQWNKGLNRKADALLSLERYPEALMVYKQLLNQSPSDSALQQKVEQAQGLLNGGRGMTASSILVGKPLTLHSADKLIVIQSLCRLMAVGCGIVSFLPIGGLSAMAHR